MDYIDNNVNQTILFEKKVIKQFLLGKFYVDGNYFSHHKQIISGIIKWKCFMTLTTCNDSNSYEGIDLLGKDYHI